MTFPRLISQRIRANHTGSFSATVSRIGVASVAIGIAVLIISFSVLIGFKQIIKNKLFSLSAHIEVSKFSVNESFQETPLSTDSKFFKSYKTNNSIKHLQLVAHKAGMLQRKDNIAGIVLKGVGQDFDWNNFALNMQAGRKIAFQDSSSSKEIIISSLIAKQLEIKLGDAVMVYFVQETIRARKLTVVGIYETGLEEFDKNIILGDIALVQKLNGWDKNTVGSYQIFVNDFDKIDAVSDEIQNSLDHDLQAVKVTEKFAPLFDWLKMLDRNIIIVLTLIFLVVGFNIISVVLVLIMERTQMVGLLKALGSSDAQIGQIFFYTGANIIFRGLLWGNFLGLGLCLIQYYFKIMPLDAQNYYISYVPIEIDWLTVLLLNLSVLLIISLVVLIPTLILPKISPVKALKFIK